MSSPEAGRSSRYVSPCAQWYMKFMLGSRADGTKICSPVSLGQLTHPACGLAVDQKLLARYLGLLHTPSTTNAYTTHRIVTLTAHM